MAWRHSSDRHAAQTAVWWVAAVTLGFAALGAAMDAAQATVLRRGAGLFHGAHVALFVTSWCLALVAARSTQRCLNVSLVSPTPLGAARLTVAWLALAMLTAPLIMNAAHPEPAVLPASTEADALNGVEFSFVTHAAPRAPTTAVARNGPLLAVSAGLKLRWVDHDGVRPVAPTDRFPRTTQVLMDQHASVSDFVAVADVAIARGAAEVAWVLPREDWPAGQEFRPACTPTQYGLPEAMAGSVTSGPMTVRAVEHPAQANPGLPWTDELGPLAETRLYNVLGSGMTVELQRWSPPGAAHATRTLMVERLLVGLALGFALFAMRLMRDAIAAHRLTREADARPRGVVRQAVLRLRWALVPLVAAMLVLSGTLLLAS